MLIELALAGLLLVAADFGLKYIICGLLVICIWLSTFLLSVPCHQRLNRGKNLKVINLLIMTNWPRTILWSLKAICLLLLKA